MLKKTIRNLSWTLLLFCLAGNIIAAVHAYKFTHFTSGGVRTERLNLSFFSKVKLLFTGVDNPRPMNMETPSLPYTTIVLNSNVKIECWCIPTDQKAKGTVLLFHGYTSNKSALLNRANVFLQNGYNCVLTDFMGSGGSGGNQTTIGYYEAVEVKDVYNYIKNTGEPHIFLYGSSMGAVAIMKSLKDYNLAPESIIIECPFGAMYKTVCARFDMFHVPRFPLAGMLLFWGSVENNFWGFSHNPTDYAKYIKCRTLLQYGEQDDRVTCSEIDNIYSNLKCPKKLIIYPQAGHDDYLAKCTDDWTRNVITFLNECR